MVEEKLCADNIDNCLEVKKKDSEGNIVACKIKEGVKEIWDESFLNWDKLEEIILPESLEEIYCFAFKNCTSLKSIVLPKNIKTIEYSAFENCTSLESVNLPEGIDFIDNSVFSNCTSLKSISLPESIKVIDDYAFENCTSLKSINLPEGLEEIRDFVFRNCTSFETFKLPLSVKYIGEAILDDCNDKLKVTIPEGWENSQGLCDWFDDAVEKVFNNKCNIESIRSFVIKEAAKDSYIFVKLINKKFDDLFDEYHYATELAFEIAKAGGEAVLYAMSDQGYFDEENRLCGKLIDLANADHPAAQCILGQMIENEASYTLETIESWYNGNPYAPFETDWYYEACFNDYLPKYKENEFTAVDAYIEYVSNRAMKGCARSQYILAQCYEFGYGVKKDQERADLWYEKAKAKKENE